MKNDAHDIVRRPLITEKGTDLTAKHNAYTFLVAPTANKAQIKRAIEELFKVKVLGVRTMVRQRLLSRSNSEESSPGAVK